MKQFLFGYGSLVGEQNAVEGSLRGYHRAWNVAMDNRVDLPGYKYYLDRYSRQRHSCFVTFLNIFPSRNKSVNGILFPVSDNDLAKLDQRERNYRRINVSNQFESPCGLVWTYTATDEGRARYELGVSNGTAVIHDEYLISVNKAFRSRGSNFYQQYLESTDPPIIPIRKLDRIVLS